MEQQKNKGKFWYLDTRTKLVLILCCVITLSDNFSSKFMIANFFAIIFLMAVLGKPKTALKFLLTYIIVGILPICIINETSGIWKVLLTSSSGIVLMFSSIFGAIHLLISTTTVSDSIASLQKMHFSDSVIIPFAVTFRFIPTLKEEWASIRQAMKFRNIGTSFWRTLKNPMLNLEYVLIPLMMSTVMIAEELASASMSRGLVKGGRRVPVREAKLRGIDYVVCLIFLSLMVASKIFGEGKGL